MVGSRLDKFDRLTMTARSLTEPFTSLALVAAGAWDIVKGTAVAPANVTVTTKR